MVQLTKWRGRTRKGASFALGEHMHQQFANAFYGSQAWKNCRAAYRKARGNLCERCLARGLITAGTREMPLQVHHKVELTPENSNDPRVTLSWDNLQLLCKRCHDEQHMDERKRWIVDEDGRVVIR